MSKSITHHIGKVGYIKDTKEKGSLVLKLNLYAKAISTLQLPQNLEDAWNEKAAQSKIIFQQNFFYAQLNFTKYYQYILAAYGRQNLKSKRRQRRWFGYCEWGLLKETNMFVLLSSKQGYTEIITCKLDITIHSYW